MKQSQQDIVAALSVSIADTLMLDEEVVERKCFAMGCLGMSDVLQWFMMLINVNTKLERKYQALKEKMEQNCKMNEKKMEEHYQSKFHNEFHEGSNPTVINEATFNAPIYIGVKRGDVPPKSVEDINTAIRKLIADGTLTESKQWYAIYKVLTAHLSYPTDKKAFCEQMMLHKLDDISIPCIYENWRKAQNDYAKLPANVDFWDEDNATSTKEKAMIKVAKELMKLLGLNC